MRPSASEKMSGALAFSTSVVEPSSAAGASVWSSAGTLARASSHNRTFSQFVKPPAVEPQGEACARASGALAPTTAATRRATRATRIIANISTSVLRRLETDFFMTPVIPVRALVIDVLQHADSGAECVAVFHRVGVFGRAEEGQRQRVAGLSVDEGAIGC